MLRFCRTLLAPAALALTCASSSIAVAQSSTVVVETQRGQAEIERNVDRSRDDTTGSSAIATRNSSVERSFDRNFDSETGTYTVNRSTVTANGAQSSSTATVNCDGAGNCTREGSYVGPRGETGGSRTTASRAENGDITARTEAIRPNGEAVTRDRFVTGERGNRSGEVVNNGPNGQSTRKFERRFQRGEGISSSSATTGPQGRTRLVDRQGVRTGRGEFAGQRTVTSPTGNTRTNRSWVRVDRNKRRD
ncbi:MAG: hypothetical protein AAF292_12175 [Pseudomonadota bacterium]